MGTLINIDNGGTLTDICVWDGNAFTFTKTLTTPHDLSECLFTGIEKASDALYGEADITRLLHATEHIRYSTTQGTNALVERRGPMIGILSAMPVSLGGRGVMEALYIVFFAGAGVADRSALLALALLARLLPMCLSLPGLAFWLTGRGRQGPAPAE